MRQARRGCELCGGEAAAYCDADGAFLCWACDGAVHGANFLVARHRRWVACRRCGSLDPSRHVSGARPPPSRPICRSCDPDPTLSSDSCLSTAESTATPPEKLRVASAAGLRRTRRGRSGVDARAEGVLMSWGRKMGVRSGRRCAGFAAHVLGACAGAAAGVPYRVALAGALWFAVKLCEEGVAEGNHEAAALRRLEACSGVPARLIALAESRLARAMSRATRVKAKEGWAECS